MTLLEKYEERLKQLEKGSKELYEGEMELIKEVIAKTTRVDQYLASKGFDKAMEAYLKTK